MHEKMTFLGLALAASLLARADIYVDCRDANAADDTAEGRGGAELPYATIQAAVNAAAEGETVWVRPGVYTNGTANTPSSGGIGNTSQQNRVMIDKRIRLESTRGAAVTEIRGAWKPGGTYGVGAIRAVYIAPAASNTVVKGFTIANGSTRNDTASKDRGGGVFFQGADRKAYVVDCVVSNCYAKGGSGLSGVTAMRSRVDYCYSGSWDYGSIENANLWNCVVREKNYGNGYRTFTSVTSVNCTYACANYMRVMDCAFYNCLVCAFGTLHTSDGGNTFANCVDKTSSQGLDQCFSPFTGDCRLLNTSDALNAGDTAYLRSIIAIPDEFATKDYDGNAIDYTAATCHAGAVQSSVTPEHGSIAISDRNSYYDGNYVAAKARVRSSEYPKQFCVTGETPILYLSNANGNVFPVSDGSFLLTVPYDPATNVSFWPAMVAATYWVDDDGDDGNAGAEDSPFKTIQKALDVIGDLKYGLVNVKGGVYDEGGVEKNGVFTRVAYSATNGYKVRIHAVEGPENTFIVGSTNGVDDVRCCSGSSGGMLIVDGFTLTGGRISSTSANGAASIFCHVVGCMVSNNTSATTICHNDQNLMRSRFVGNVAGTSLYYGTGAVAFSYFHGNTSGDCLISGAGNPFAFNCTFTGNSTPVGTSLLGINYVFPNNCLIDAGGGTYSRTSHEGDIGPNFAWNFTLGPTSYANAQIVERDPMVVGDGDERLFAMSPAIGAGLVGSTRAYMVNYHHHLQGDIDGRPNAFTSDGRTTMGCNQHDFVNGVYLSAVEDGLTVTGIGTGFTPVRQEESMPISIAPDTGASRLATGLVLTDVSGGVTTNLFADLPGGVWAHTVSGSSDALSIEALYNGEWYVDAENGDDANSGFYADAAKRTLANVVTNAGIRAGDVVYALPGTYDAGYFKSDIDTYTYSRVIVPQGVSLVSTEGPDVTFIKGANAPVNPPGTTDGRGTNATRCVFMESNSRLEGFSIVGGRTFHEWSNQLAVDCSGGGVLARDGTATIVDCRFSNCVGGSGAAGYRGVYLRCRADGCALSAAYSFGSATLVSCIVVLNSSSIGTCVSDCTIYNSFLKPYAGYFAVNGAATKAYNSILLGQNVASGHYYGCVMATNKSNNAWSGSTFFNDANCVDCVHTNIEALALGDDFSPQSADNFLVDAGFEEYRYTGCPEAGYDIRRAPRVMNGCVDIGPYEWDIRGGIKAVLGAKVKSVDFVTANVTASDGRIALVGDGESITATIKSAGDVMIEVAVDGGAATVLLNGIAVEPTGGDYRFAVAPGDVLVVRHDGAGTAYAGRLASTRGGIIIVM